MNILRLIPRGGASFWLTSMPRTVEIETSNEYIKCLTANTSHLKLVVPLFPFNARMLTNHAIKILIDCRSRLRYYKSFALIDLDFVWQVYPKWPMEVYTQGFLVCSDCEATEYNCCCFKILLIWHVGCEILLLWHAVCCNILSIWHAVDCKVLLLRHSFGYKSLSLWQLWKAGIEHRVWFFFLSQGCDGSLKASQWLKEEFF